MDMYSRSAQYSWRKCLKAAFSLMTTRPLIAEKVQVYLNLWQNIPASQFIYDHSKHFPDEFIVLITSSKSHLIQHDDHFCKLLFDGGILLSSVCQSDWGWWCQLFFFQVKASEVEKSVWCHSNNMYMFYLHFKGLTSPNGDTTKGVDLQYTGNPSRVCITFCPVTGGIGSWFG